MLCTDTILCLKLLKTQLCEIETKVYSNKAYLLKIKHVYIKGSLIYETRIVLNRKDCSFSFIFTLRFRGTLISGGTLMIAGEFIGKVKIKEQTKKSHQ